jgi:hypothetical protein
VGTPCQTEENVTGLSSPKAKTPGQNNHEDGEELEISPKCDKHHVFNSKKESHEKKTKKKKRKTQTKKKAIPDKKDCETIQQQQAGSGFESKKNSSVAVVSFERCPNRRRIQELEPSLGELCRVGSFGGTSGTMWTTEEPKTLCHLVLPNNFHTQNFERQASVYKVSEGNGLHESSHAHNSSFMLVEKIKNECDRHRVATSVMLNLSSKESELTELELTESELTQYLEGIKEFGFNHIIIVGERDYGVFFLDCYGRMFDWDSINSLLWPLGNYLENKPKRVAWAVELNGTITEFEIGTCDIHSFFLF